MLQLGTSVNKTVLGAILLLLFGCFVIYASVLNLSDVYQDGKITVCMSLNKGDCKYKAIYSVSSQPMRYWLHFFEIPAVGLVCLFASIYMFIQALINAVGGSEAIATGTLAKVQKAALGIACFCVFYWAFVFWILRLTVVFR
jgi:hypothetical protein